MNRIQTESKIKIRKDLRLENKLREEMDKYNKELEAFHATLKEMPDKVSIIEVLRGRPMNKADLEKKKIYDLIQMIAFHSREHLISLFRSCYDDPRDVKQILTKITVIVLLDWVEDKKHRKAAIKFCHLINSMSPKLKGRMEFKLYFRISSIPQGTIAVENRCTI